MSLRITEHIYKSLSENEKIKERCKGRLIPVYTDRDMPMPFIAYERNKMICKTTKDGYNYDTTNVTIFVFSKDYAESLELAQAVRDVFSEGEKEYERFVVEDCRLKEAGEGHLHAVYIQTLDFDFDSYDKEQDVSVVEAISSGEGEEEKEAREEQGGKE